MLDAFNSSYKDFPSTSVFRHLLTSHKCKSAYLKAIHQPKSKESLSAIDTPKPGIIREIRKIYIGIDATLSTGKTISNVFARINYNLT